MNDFDRFKVMLLKHHKSRLRRGAIKINKVKGTHLRSINGIRRPKKTVRVAWEHSPKNPYNTKKVRMAIRKKNLRNKKRRAYHTKVAHEKKAAAAAPSS